MNGGVIEGTPIGVDIFKVRDYPSVKVFFLTHAHSDHMEGLKRSWNSGLIYMSPITARIIRHKDMVSNKFIKELEVGESHSIHGDNFENFAVTVIDANHCPGSVMYLFQGRFGNILHTGDFRYDPSMFQNEALSGCSHIDRLYLDNTYCDKNCLFGTREEITKEIIDLIETHPETKVKIGITKLGKEKLLTDIAKYFDVPIVVSVNRFQLFKAMECIPNVFTIEKKASYIQAVHWFELYNNCSKFNSHDYLLIRPTAFYLGTNKFVCEKVICVPYSDHSSFKELEEFVSILQPASIIPIVNYAKPKSFHEEDLSHRSDMSVFDKYLYSRPFSPLNDGDVLQTRKRSNYGAKENRYGNVTQMSNNGETSKRKKKSSTTIVPLPRVVSKGVMFTDDNSSSEELDVIRFTETSSEGSALSSQVLNLTMPRGKRIERSLEKELARTPLMELEESFRKEHVISPSHEINVARDIEGNFSEEQEELHPGNGLNIEENVLEELNFPCNDATDITEKLPKEQENSASEETYRSLVTDEELGPRKHGRDSNIEKEQKKKYVCFPRKRSEIVKDWENFRKVFYSSKWSK